MATNAPEGNGNAYRPMPLVGPPIPGPLPVEPLPGQSILAWALAAAGLAAPDVVGGQPALLVLELFVVVPPLEEGGEFGATGLPVPSVRELMPDVDGVLDCAYETPEAASKASSSAVEVSGFMIPPRECKADMVQGACRHCAGMGGQFRWEALRCNPGGIVARHFGAGRWVRCGIGCRTVVGGAMDSCRLASSVRGRYR